MIVPWHDPEEMIQVNDFESVPGFFPGQLGVLSGTPDAETLVRAPIVPIWWCE
jgi:hypothetical protein